MMSLAMKSYREDAHVSEDPASDELHVLIIEDDDDTRANLADILALDHYRVSSESSVATALRRCDWPRIDAIILDRKLPDGMAETLLPDLQARAPQAQTIIVTAYADLDGTIAALRLGAADYIIKPINPDALRASLRRIAAHRQITQALDEQRRFAELVLETAEAMILVLDLDGRIVRFNRYVEQLTGYRPLELRGASWWGNFVTARDQARIREMFHQVTHDRRAAGIIYPIVCRDGRECAIRWSNSAVVNELGEVTAILAVGLDISDITQAQERLLQAERLATIGQTMAGLAHESGNALQRIKISVQLLEANFEGHPEALLDLARIERASDDLKLMLDEVRSYAAPIHLERQMHVLAQVWRRAWNTLRTHWSNRQVEFEERVDDPACSCSIDARRLEQVFRNLFQNALEACPDPLHLTVECQTTPTTIRCTVHDNGRGLDAGVRAKIFEPFFTTKPYGTGLGLAIVKRIVDAHDGQISVLTSARGSGASFLLELPRP